MYKYNTPTKTEKKIANEIAERTNKLRNDIAHGNMDIQFTKENTRDIKFMEILFYVLILLELGISTENIIGKILYLFDIKPFVLNKTRTI